MTKHTIDHKKFTNSIDKFTIKNYHVNMKPISGHLKEYVVF